MEGSLRDFGQGAEGRPRGQRSFASPCGRTGATQKLHSCGCQRQRGISRRQRRSILVAVPPRFLGAVIGAALAGEFFRAAGGLVKGIVGVLHAHRLGVVPVLRSGHPNARDPRHVGALQVSQPRRGFLHLFFARFASDPPLLLVPAAPPHASVFPPLRTSVAQHILLPFPLLPAVHQYELVSGQTHPPELDVKAQQLSNRAQQQQPEGEIHGISHQQKGLHGLGIPEHAPSPTAASVRLRVNDRDTLARSEPCQKERHGRHRPPEIPVVRRSDTRIEPLAVVVESADALITVFAVHGVRMDGRLAQPAVFRERTPWRPPLVRVGAAGRRQGAVHRLRDTADRAPEDRQEGVHARERAREEGRRHDPDAGGVTSGLGEVGAQFRIDGIRRDGAVAQDRRSAD
mmetsp:Transcript_5420/g.8034  ORF Transcript_5420/g.8034 Transcript_5420/m.8034 type:complete len:401 (+) Transcript_5420:973-2175(+)